MRVGPPMGQESTTTPCLPRGVQVHTRPTRSNADCTYEFQGRSRGSGTADGLLDGKGSRRSLPAAQVWDSRQTRSNAECPCEFRMSEAATWRDPMQQPQPTA